MVGAFAGYFIALNLGFGTVVGRPAYCADRARWWSRLLVGMAIESLAYRPVRKYARMTSLITAIGVSLLLENLFVVLFGGRAAAFRNFCRMTPLPLFGNAAISKSQILIFAVSIALMVILQWIIYKTKVGTAMRAVSFNLNSAKLMGINTECDHHVYVRAGFGAGGGGRRVDGAIQPDNRSADGDHHRV